MSKPRSLGSSATAPARQSRVFCPQCIEYLDGKPVLNAYDGRHERMPHPGWQLHKTSAGSLYSRVGIVIPCTCAAGQAFQRGMFNPDSQTDNQPWFDTYTQMELKPFERPPYKNSEPEPDSDFVPAGKILQEKFL